MGSRHMSKVTPESRKIILGVWASMGDVGENSIADLWVETSPAPIAPGTSDIASARHDFKVVGVTWRRARFNPQQGVSVQGWRSGRTGALIIGAGGLRDSAAMVATLSTLHHFDASRPRTETAAPRSPGGAWSTVSRRNRTSCFAPPATSDACAVEETPMEQTPQITGRRSVRGARAVIKCAAAYRHRPPPAATLRRELRIHSVQMWIAATGSRAGVSLQGHDVDRVGEDRPAPGLRTTTRGRGPGDRNCSNI